MVLPKFDRGGKFRNKLQTICDKLYVKVIRSSAYHPHSQGKVERSHRTFRDKVRYDVLRKGQNWVESLHEYENILNNDAKRELGGKSPFEVYYHRKSNDVLRPNAESDTDSEGDDVLHRPKVWPTMTKEKMLLLDE